MQRYRAAVVGGTGFGGGELIRRLLSHPEVDLVRVTSIEHVGKPVREVHLNLEGQTDLRFEQMAASDAAQDVDVVLLGLPHQVSAEVVPSILSTTEAKVIDMSGAFRTDDEAAYRLWYGGTHPAPQYLSQFVYGLTELRRPEIKSARCVANPGCFATAIQLSLLPVANLIEGEIKTVAMTGSSGSGINPSLGTHHPVRSGNLKAYRPLHHPQSVEVEQTLRKETQRALSFSFVPVSAPLARGILATSLVRLREDIGEQEVKDAFTDYFKGSRFVRVVTSRLPEVVAVAGSNYVEVGFQVAQQGAGRTLCCMSALDNLIKGGAGQAIQNMNLMLGLDETLSLLDPGAYP